MRGFTYIAAHTQIFERVLVAIFQLYHYIKARIAESFCLHQRF